MPAPWPGSEDALNLGREDALLRPFQTGRLGLRRRPCRKTLRPCRKTSAGSRELLLSRGLWPKAELEPEGRGDKS